MILATPDFVQKKFGAPAKTVGRAIPHVIKAFRGAQPRHARKGCKACRLAGTADTCTHTAHRPQTANSQKFNFIVSTVSMMCAGVLPAEGAKRNWVERDITQEDLATMVGVSRPTISRRLSSIANPDEAWDADRRQRASEREKQRAKAKGKNVSDAPRVPIETLPEGKNVLHRSRRFAEPNRYAFANMPERQFDYWVVEAIPDRSEQGYHAGKMIARRLWSKAKAQELCDEKNREAGEIRYVVEARALPKSEFHCASIDELLSNPEVAALWGDANRPGIYDGYKEIPQWIWGWWVEENGERVFKSLPISDTAKAVFSMYVMCGLLDPDDPARGKVFGKLEGWHQYKIAEMVGIDVRTLYDANCELEGIGLIKIVAREGAQKKPDGSGWTSKPQMVIFVPAEEAYQEKRRLQAERNRLLHRIRAIQDARERAWIAALATDLFDQWASSGQKVEALWSTMRQALQSHGVAADVIDSIAARPPE